jgi:hypothetical protein
MNTGTRIFCHFPGLFVPHIRRGERPQGASPGFDRVDETVLFFGKENAEPVQGGLQLKAAEIFFTKPGEKKIHRYFQESGNIFYFAWLKENAALSVTAIPAHLALKGFHNK